MRASISAPMSSQISAPSYEPMVTSYWLFDFFFSHGELPWYRNEFLCVHDDLAVFRCDSGEFGYVQV